MIVHTILYVADQNRSMEYYKYLLGMEPTLNVPGMTEFKLNKDHILGLMPESGIKRLLGEKIPDPAKGNGIPRAELYLRVSRPEPYFDRAIKLNSPELSPMQERDWGDRACYIMDPDGHIIAFATLPPDL